jgi:hypothetical protein
MPKLGTIFLLPAAQVALALFLLAWSHQVRSPRGLDTLYVPTPYFVCMGINAPVLMIKPLISLVAAIPKDHVPWSIFGFGLDEILFLLAVAVLWYLVARWFATFRSRKMDHAIKTNTAGLLWQIVMAAIGGLLCLLGVGFLRSSGRFNNTEGNIAEGALFIIWAFALLLVSARALLAAKR